MNNKFFLWRVCDWSDSGRNSLAILRALGRCVWNAADTEQERSGCVVEAEWNTLLERIQRAVMNQGEALPRSDGKVSTQYQL